MMISASATATALDLIKELFELQADNQKREELIVEYSNEKATRGMTLLQVAILRGHTKVRMILVDSRRCFFTELIFHNE